jgi:hypothetical protein
MVTFAEVRRLALSLPRTTEHLVNGRIKFRIKSIVYVGMSADEQTMGFGFPKEERAALVASEPHKFFLPEPTDMRFNWVRAHLDQIDEEEMTELVVDAWQMCVPKFLAREHLGDPPDLRRAIELAYVHRPETASPRPAPEPQPEARAQAGAKRTRSPGRSRGARPG